MTTQLLGSYNGTGIIDLLCSEPEQEILSFHYGNFNNAYGDGDVATDAANGRVYADTVPSTLPTKFGSFTTSGTSGNQTTYSVTPPPAAINAHVLLVAGGGGGSCSGSSGGGG